jgi:parallel beta-helix repeat protein
MNCRRNNIKKTLIHPMIILIIAAIITGPGMLIPEHSSAADGEVSWWKLDENVGTMAGDSWDANHGTVYGATWTAGKLGGALEFDGVDDYVEVTDSLSLNPDHITVEAWVYPSGLGDQTYPAVVKKAGESDSQDHGYALEIDPSDMGTYFGVFVSDVWVLSPDVVIPADSWSHLAGTYDGSSVKIYLNGTFMGETGASGNIQDSGLPLNIGRDPKNTSRIFQGKIDEVKIYDRALSDADFMFEVWGEPLGVWVDDSWCCQADVDLFDPSLTWQYDAFATIQNGIAAVHEDGTVHVRPGKYNENVVIGKSLTLQSVSGNWQDTIIGDAISEAEIAISGDVDVTVRGFEITAGSSGIDIANGVSTVNILDCFIHGNGGLGIHVAGAAETSSITIEGNAISENGFDGINSGSGASPVFGNVIIRDNIIGAWTCYDGEYGYSGSPQRYYGNGDRGIEIVGVGASGTVTIESNKISENHRGDIDETGIYIESIYGVVTIEGNDIGSWTDRHGASYLGNNGAGILIANVFSGAELTIGPNNSIKNNLGDGIAIGLGEASSHIEIHHNQIDANGGKDEAKPEGLERIIIEGCGIKLGSGGVCGAMVSDNIITNHHEGVHLDEYSRNTIVQNNEIRDNAEGIWIEGDNNQILRNDILNNKGAPASGIHLTSTALGNIMHCNNIEGNLPWGVYNDNADETVDAISNWWGDASGPSAVGPGSGDAVSENVNYSSWLSSEFQYCRECQGLPAPAVPTVNHWGIVAMITLFAGLLVWTVRRRRAAS